MMWYEINVSTNKGHLFATNKRSLVSEKEAIKLFNLFKEKFSIREGYQISTMIKEKFPIEDSTTEGKNGD